MSRSAPDPVVAALSRLRGVPVPTVDVADRVMARVARLPLPARSEPRLGLGVAAAIAAVAAATPAFLPAATAIRAAASEAIPALVAVARPVVVAAASSAEALVRATGGLSELQSIASTAGTLALASGCGLALLLVAREIRRAPALARSPR